MIEIGLSFRHKSVRQKFVETFLILKSLFEITAMSSPQSSTDEKTMMTSTVATTLTGPGRSAIAVIVVAGDQAANAINQYFRRATPTPMRPGQIRYGTWLSGSKSDAVNEDAVNKGVAGESVVVTPVADDQFEVHCHGGQAAISVILSDLQDFGVGVASGVQGLGKKPLLVQEAVSVLVHCTTAKNAAIAMDQVRGAMQDWAAKVVRRAHTQADSIITEARQMLAYAPMTTHLAEPYRVVLVGAPNVGKSSLTNAILGYSRSITMNTAGTTRDVLHAETVIGGIPIRISDTAGIRQKDEIDDADEIEKEGIRRAIEQIETADLVVRVRDPETDFAKIPDHIKSINVTNKSDLATSGLHEQPSTQRSQSKTQALLVSATTGDGVAALLSEIASELVPCRPPAGSPAAITQRQLETLRRIVAASDVGQIAEAASEMIGDSTDLAQLAP